MWTRRFYIVLKLNKNKKKSCVDILYNHKIFSILTCKTLTFGLPYYIYKQYKYMWIIYL